MARSIKPGGYAAVSSDLEERKLATILFADLVGSTSLAHDQDPERIRFRLNQFYDAMTEEIERLGGTVEKFAGDAVMAAFGAPSALEDHAERAVHAGLAMQRRLHDLFGGGLSLRIGVNTGEVIAGQARAGSSFVTGDAVNVAARLEQAAAADEILAGERTVAAALGAFEFGEAKVVAAKGKPDGIWSRPVRRALSLMRPRGVSGLPSVFVGREAELSELQDRYRAVATTGEPRLVTVLGDAGVGKTRLMRELWAWLGSQSPAPIRRAGRTLSYGRGAAYWPMGEILKEHFDISEDDPPSAIAALLTDHPYLGLTLGVPVGEELHPLAARERLHDAWVEFAEALARSQPTVLLVEDLHWADDDLFDLLDTVVRQVSGPLLVLGTGRPELVDRRSAWAGARGRTSAMRLDALPVTDTDRLLRELLRIEVPTEVRDIVVERAEGNPFFLEELIATFIDRGVLQRNSGTWVFQGLPPGFTLPDSVQAVLAARIDLLPEVEKAALQAAAVIGRTFWSGPVYELLAGRHPNIGVLEERDFVRRRPGSTLAGEREYVIKHALTREVAYGSLTKARRAELHAAFASWLERRDEGRDDLTPLLAHHYAQAVRPQDADIAWAGREAELARLQTAAVAWSRRAAEQAVGRYEIDEAIALLRRAVELEPRKEEQAGLWYEIGHASALKYDGEGFVAAMERSLALGAPEGQVYAELAYQTSQRQGMWKRRLDRALVNEWIDRALRSAREGTPPKVRAMVAKASWQNDLDAGLEALRLADSLEDDGLRSAALHPVQVAFEARGDLDEAWRHAQLRAELLPSITDPDHVADTLMGLIDLQLNIGRIAQARAGVVTLEDTVAGLTPHHRVHGLGTRVRLHAAIGEWEAVRALTPQAEEWIELNLATPCPFNVGSMLLAASAMTYGSDRAEADRLVAKAESIGMVGYEEFMTPRWLLLAIAQRNQAVLRRTVDSITADSLTAGAWDLVAVWLDALSELGDRDRIEAEAPKWIRPDGYAAAFAVKALGVARRDPGLLKEAAKRFESMGITWHAARAREASALVGAG